MTYKKASGKKQDNIEILLYTIGTILLGLNILIVVVIVLNVVNFLFSTGEISLVVAIVAVVSILAPVAAFCVIVYKFFNPSSGGKKDE